MLIQPDSSLKLKWCENRIAVANELCLLVPSGPKQALWTYLSPVRRPCSGTWSVSHFPPTSRQLERSHRSRDQVENDHHVFIFFVFCTCTHALKMHTTSSQTHRHEDSTHAQFTCIWMQMKKLQEPKHTKAHCLTNTSIPYTPCVDLSYYIALLLPIGRAHSVLKCWFKLSFEG